MDTFNNKLAIEPYGIYSFILGQTTKCIMGTILYITYIHPVSDAHQLIPKYLHYHI